MKPLYTYVRNRPGRHSVQTLRLSPQQLGYADAAMAKLGFKRVYQQQLPLEQRA